MGGEVPVNQTTGKDKCNNAIGYLLHLAVVTRLKQRTSKALAMKSAGWSQRRLSNSGKKLPTPISPSLLHSPSLFPNLLRLLLLEFYPHVL